MIHGSGPEIAPAAGTTASKEPAPALIAHAFEQASQPLRAKLLSLLLRPVGPLALVAIASGAFATLLRRRPWQGTELPLDEAARITGDQILELARYVEQASPDLIAQVAALIASALG